MNGFIQFSEKWLELFSLHMLEVSLFVALVFAVDFFSRLPVRYRYFLWLAALAKVFFPPLLSMPRHVEQSIPVQFYTLPLVTPAPGPIVEAPEVSLTLSGFLFLAWLLVAAGLAFFAILKNVKLLAKFKTAKGIELTQKNSDLQNIPCFESNAITSPILLGIRKPRLFLPAEWQSWNERQLNSIIAHEVAHLQFRDIWVLVLQYVGLILFWFNPLVWLLHLRLNEIREKRCDEIAVAQTGLKPTEYSNLLVDIVEQNKKAMLSFAIGKSFSEEKKSLRDRINHILNFEEAKMKKKSVLHVALPVVLCLLVLPFSWQCSGRQVDPMAPELSQDALKKTNVPAGQGEFVPFDTPPKPVGGFKTIQETLVYPKEAKENNIEGRVILQLQIDENGKIVDYGVLRSLSPECDSAAVEAATSIEWQPALQGDKPVKVWVAIPVVFSLSGSKPLVDPMAPELSQDALKKTNVPAGQGEFVPFDTPPKPAGGFKTIQEMLVYPKEAKENNIEGRVILQLQIDENGTIVDYGVLRSLSPECDSAAVEAAISIEWQPALQGDKPVKVWVAIPVIFRLSISSSDIVESEVPPLPPMPDWIVQNNGEQKFVRFDEPPSPEGGIEAIQTVLKYPKVGQLAGIEGMVVLQLLISEEGEIVESKVLKDMGNKSGFEQAALNAAEAVKWEPARKDGEAIESWVTIPVKFKLNDEAGN